MPAVTSKSSWYIQEDGSMCQIWYFENGVELPWCIPAPPDFTEPPPDHQETSDG